MNSFFQKSVKYLIQKENELIIIIKLFFIGVQNFIHSLMINSL